MTAYGDDNQATVKRQASPAMFRAAIPGARVGGPAPKKGAALSGSVSENKSQSVPNSSRHGSSPASTIPSQSVGAKLPRKCLVLCHQCLISVQG